jgi:hypothetical protein
MGLVVALAIAALAAGCYDPALRDCTVACTGAGQCARDQVCGMDGYCVAGAAARCTGSMLPVDAAIDAPIPTVALHVTVMGHGSVTVAGTGGGTCAMDCTYKLAQNSRVSAVATGTGGKQFQMWTTPNCAGQAQTCTFTLAMPQNLGARFE